MKVFIIILTLLASAAIAFAITFTIVTFYIARHRRVKAKYHFVGTADARIAPDNNLEKEYAPGTVDGESAQREWERRRPDV